ncbi:MAG: hypothetical protein L6U99_08490 [Clostridium sp.]|nr:MAG: hypothetical protein L6U99_08490 [Clostridium sp.]
MLGIESSDYQFGVNIFSGEPSYSYDPKKISILLLIILCIQRKKTNI